MPETRSIEIGVVVSITSGKLLAPFGGIQETVEWFVDRPVFTHAMPDVADQVAVHLRQQYPVLATLTVPTGLDDWEKVHAFLQRVRQETTLGEKLEVTRPEPGTVEAWR